MICPICYKTLTRAFVVNCEHTFCDMCIAQHCWRCALITHRAATCPICRAPIKTLQPFILPQSADFYRFCEERRIRFAKQEFRIDVRSGAGETTFTRLAHLFDIPLERLKLIHKGHFLTTEDEINAVGKDASVQLLGTPQMLQMPREGLAGRTAVSAKDLLLWLMVRLRLAQLWHWITHHRFAGKVSSFAREGRRVLSLFVESIAPGYRSDSMPQPPPPPPGNQA